MSEAIYITIKNRRRGDFTLEAIMYDTVIFDMDGTLLDTLDDLTLAVNHTLRQYSFPTHTREEIRSFIGNGINRLMKNASPADIDDETFDRVFHSFKEYYTAHSVIHTRPFSGILPMLKSLQQRGIKTAIVSNKNIEAVQALNEHFFSDYVKIAIGERPGIRRKPYPDTLLEAMRLLDADKTLYVGDSVVDKQTADNAGVDCVLVRWGYGTDIDSLHPAGITDTPDELLDML